MTGTDLCVKKPHCAAVVRPWDSEATTTTLPPARVRTCSVMSGSFQSDEQLWLQKKNQSRSYLNHLVYTGRFIMFSVITNIYNKKPKGPTLMALFTARGKLKKFVLTTRYVGCVHHGRHGTHRYDIQVTATNTSTWVHRYFLLQQWSVPLGQRGHVAMVGRILGLWHIPKEKIHRA